MITSSAKKRIVMSSLPKEALEFIADWAEIFTVVLALASAVCGIVLVMANKPLKRITERETQEERQKTAKAQEEAATAQLALKQYLDDVSQRVRPRSLVMSNVPSEESVIYFGFRK